jgi:hypothetical protein
MDHRYFVPGEPDNFLIAFNSKAYQSSLLFDTKKRGCLKTASSQVKDYNTENFSILGFTSLSKSE